VWHVLSSPRFFSRENKTEEKKKRKKKNSTLCSGAGKYAGGMSHGREIKATSQIGKVSFSSVNIAQVDTREISEGCTFFFFLFFSLFLVFTHPYFIFSFLKWCFVLVTCEIPGLVFCLNSMFFFASLPSAAGRDNCQT
jgi:hypothetical protein